MSKGEVGYGQPPIHSRFRKGVSGNPKGRPRRKATPIAALIDGVLHALVECRRHGKVEMVTRHEFSLMLLADQAVGGDVAAADTLLKVWEQAERQGSGGAVIEIQDWLADEPGQTAAQKTKAALERGEKPSGATWLDDE